MRNKRINANANGNSVSLVFFCLFFILSIPSFADGGLRTPNNLITVSEPGQKALIGWNGKEEVLVLSTNVMTSEQVWVVELIPFPSQPVTPIAGTFDSFLKVEKSINTRIKALTTTGDVDSNGTIDIVDALYVAQYAMGLTPAKFNPFGADVSGDKKITIVDALKIAQYFVGLGSGLDSIDPLVVTFDEEVGVHNIVGVQTTSAAQLIDLANGLLSQKTSIEGIDWGSLEKIITDYIGKGIRYWTLDLLDLGSLEKSRTPIIYRFASDYLFFPLYISATGTGQTDIAVFTFTEKKLDPNGINASDLTLMNYGTYFDLTQPELSEISPDIATLFAGSVKLAYLNYKGSLSNLSRDLKAGLSTE
jgi:hypothetical protein